MSYTVRKIDNIRYVKERYHKSVVKTLTCAMNEQHDIAEGLKKEVLEMKAEKSYWWDYLTKVKRDTKDWLKYKKLRERENE